MVVADWLVKLIVLENCALIGLCKMVLDTRNPSLQNFVSPNGKIL